MTTPSDELRQAASLLRDRATAAIHEAAPAGPPATPSAAGAPSSSTTQSSRPYSSRPTPPDWSA
ncbi:hypothetical protein ACFVRD_41800 [Streptomyces sp. NPDC057908]|uniref:hypothetical protein n=1 Tax=Streptomyces sp. NPDC057908 TaxID=3346276 RepID=UPI0036E26D42